MLPQKRKKLRFCDADGPHSEGVSAGAKVGGGIITVRRAYYLKYAPLLEMVWESFRSFVDHAHSYHNPKKRTLAACRQTNAI